ARRWGCCRRAHERKRVQAIGEAVVDAVDSAMACQRKEGSSGGGLGGGTISKTGRSTRGATGRSAGCRLRRAETVSTVTRARQTARASLKTFDDGARTHEENKIPRDARVELVRPHLFTRSLRRFCEIFATLGIFLNRTAIQH